MKRILKLSAFIAASLAPFAKCSGALPLDTQSMTVMVSQDGILMKQFMAQVVGLQWLNPLQRRDYSTEWQLLWTLGISKPNKSDDMVASNSKKYATIQTISSIAIGENGAATFQGYHDQYFNALTLHMHDIYFSISRYFYNAHSLKDRSTWRELAGIHVEYAIPEGKLDPIQAADFALNNIRECFQIGNKNFPNSWSRDTLPEINITLGRANAGFTSLSKALDYLKAHPSEIVWTMNWDAPSRPKDKQINENMVLLVLAGPTTRPGASRLPGSATRPVTAPGVSKRSRMCHRHSARPGRRH